MDNKISAIDIEIINDPDKLFVKTQTVTITDLEIIDTKNHFGYKLIFEVVEDVYVNKFYYKDVKKYKKAVKKAEKKKTKKYMSDKILIFKENSLDFSFMHVN